MNEFMIHVERIVRPISAIQGRKLRMRAELLAHLQATLDEERKRFPDDEPAAIEHAMRRLGEPAELTGKLQQTVPIVERLLLARLPISRRLDHLEQKMARVPGQRGPMTLGHKTILTAVAMLLACASFPIYISQIVHDTSTSPAWQPAHQLLFFFGALIGLPAITFTSFRLAFATAGAAQWLDWPRTLEQAALILALQIGMIFFEAFAIVNRCATIGEVITCAASTVALLAISILIARFISLLRRPYDEWLTLDIAE